MQDKVNRSKIVILTRSLAAGGAERQIVELANGLVSNDCDITIVCMYDENILSKYLKNEVELVCINKKSRWEVFGFFYRLIKVLKDKNTEILYTFLVLPNLIGIISKLFCSNIKLVWSVRASNMDLNDYDYFSKLTFKIQAVLSRVPDLIISNSHKGAEYHLEQGFYEKKLIVIANGINCSNFTIDLELRRKFRLKYNLENYPVTMALVGRLDPMKGHLDFFQAISFNLDFYQNFKILVVGTGTDDYKRTLINRVKDLNLESIVEFVEHEQNMLGLYNAIDVLISASKYGEGFSNVLGEGLACGKVVCATDVGDARLVVGNSEYICEPSCPQDLSLLIQKVIIKNKENFINHTNREYIFSNFSNLVMVEKTKDELLNLL
ncbi:glycosyltransferase [bacterium]|nr:glycosyltransferase [bacterium]